MTTLHELIAELPEDSRRRIEERTRELLAEAAVLQQPHGDQQVTDDVCDELPGCV